MQILSSSECDGWCRDQGVLVLRRDPRLGPDLVFEQTERDSVFQIPMPAQTLKVLALSYALLADRGDSSPSRGLLWMAGWGIWSEEIDNAGIKLWEALRMESNNKKSALAEMPGHLFQIEEFLEQHALLMLPMIFQWDAYFVPEEPEFLIYICHDETVFIIARTAQICKELFRYYEIWGPIMGGRPGIDS